MWAPLRVAAPLGLVLGLSLLPSEVVAGSLPLLRAEWGASATVGGWMVSAYQLGYVLAVLVVLPLTDRVPSGRVMVGCAAVMAAAFLLFALLARNPASAMLFRFIAGAGMAGVYLPGVRVVSGRVAPERRGAAVGLYVACFYLGTSLSLLTTGLLLGAVGWRGAALTLAIISLVAAPVAFLVAWRAPAPAGRSARLRPRVLRHRPVRLTILAYVGHAWELYLSRGWLASFLAAALVARGAGALDASAEASRSAALMLGTGTLGVAAGGWLSDRLGRTRAALAVVLPGGLLSLLFGWLGGLPWLLLLGLGVGYGFLLAADSAIYSTAITELPPRDEIGSAQAAQAFFGFVATVVSPVSAGILLDLGLGWPWVFGLGGLGALLAAGALVLALRAERAPESLAAGRGA